MLAFLYGYFIVVHLALFLVVGYPLNVTHLLLLLTILVSFHAGLWLARTRRRLEISRSSFEFYAIPPLVIAGAITLYLAVRIPQLIELAAATRNGNLQSLLLQNAIDRYAGVETRPLDNLGTVVFMLVSGLMGVRFGSAPRSLASWALLPAYIVTLLVQSADLSRASVTLGLLMLSSFLLYNARFYLYRLGVRWAFKAGLVVVFGTFVIFAFGQYGRVFMERDAWAITIERASNLFLGGHYAFLVWFDSEAFTYRSDGSGMFGAVAKLVGTKFELGNYLPIQIPFGLTNIYLWYRGAIEDLGWLFWVYDFICGYAIAAMADRNPGRIETFLCLFGIQLSIYPFYSPFYFTVFFLPFTLLIFGLPRVRYRLTDDACQKRSASRSIFSSVVRL